MNLYDKNARPIERGDILKVFHFIGRRRKRHFMYKQALGIEVLGSGPPYMRISHLGMDDEYYWEPLEDRIIEDYEIVQSIGDDFEYRERKS